MIFFSNDWSPMIVVRAIWSRNFGLLDKPRNFYNDFKLLVTVCYYLLISNYSYY